MGKNEKSTESIDIGVENIINHQVLAGLNQSIVEVLSKKIHGYSIAHREYFPLNSVLRFEREKISISARQIAEKFYSREEISKNYLGTLKNLSLK